MTAKSDLLLAYYGDDFTGSTDALEFLTRAGINTTLFLDPPTPDRLKLYPGIQAVGVAGLTRSLAPDAMEKELRPAFESLRTLGARHVHYKVCSTFDSSPEVGSIGRAIDVGASVFGAPFIPLLVAAPALGRHCVFGNLFARMGIGSQGEIFRLDRHPSMSRHPVTPANESDLRLHLAKQTAKTIALFDILKLAMPATEARAELEKLLSGKPEIVLLDGLYGDQLELIGELIDAYGKPEQPLFSVGSSGIEMALGAHWTKTMKLSPPSTWPQPLSTTPLLVISGSCSPVTAAQIAFAGNTGFGHVQLDVAALTRGEDVEATIRIIVSHLRAGRHVVAYTSRGPVDTPLSRDGSRILGTTLGVIAQAAVAQGKVRRVMFAGGDTSSYAARALGIEAVEMIAPLAPGAPLCRAHSTDPLIEGLAVNFKGGQVGAEDYFSCVAFT
ncbi:MAG: four-carbon acid sugar kinase family protein [Nibricoccus sp.]